MSDLCNWSPVADADNPCYGDMSLVEFTDMATGDRVAVLACEGHRRMVRLGFYLDPGTPDPEDTDPDVSLSRLWPQDPGDCDPEDGGPCTTS